MSALMMVACSKETPETDQIPEEEPGIEYEFTATLDDQEPETEASIDFTSTGKVSWVSTDKIAVWTGSSFVEFTAKSISPDGYTATFSATVSGTPSFGKAYYPASIAGASEHQVVLPSSYASTTAAADGFPMMSDTVIPGQPVTFKHLGSFLKLTVNDAPAAATKITVSSITSGKYLSGTFTTNYNNGSPALTATSGNASVTVPKAGTVYLPIPADTYSLRIEVKDNDGFNYYRRDVSGTKTFARATLKKAKITVTAPKQYYVTTTSSNTQYDVTYAPLIRVSDQLFESFMNCGASATLKFCDEFNLNNPNGYYSNTGYVGDANLYRIYYNAADKSSGPDYNRSVLSDPWGYSFFSSFTMAAYAQFNSWSDLTLTYNGNHIWVADNISISESGEYGFKFRQAESWDNAWGSNVYQATYGDAWGNNADNIKATLEPGVYSLYVNAAWDNKQASGGQTWKHIKYCFYKH